jgi:4,5-dihydroxyphthalate decarboxylase
MRTMTAEQTKTLDACFGNYPQTAALKSGRITSDRIALRLTEVNPIYKSFFMMVRELKFDVCEIALVTFLQAKAFGKSLTLLPATMMGRFQHGTMLYNAERGTVTPQNLAGRRVGVRSFAQTTGCWIRGILWKDYGVDLAKVKWVTFEDAHIAEFRDPPGVERAADGKDMTRMVLDGELDAAIFGTVLPTDPRLKSVIPDPEAAAQDWYDKYRTVPINHMVAIKTSLSQSDPGAVREVFRMLHESKRAAGLPKPGVVDTIPFGFDHVKPALDLMSSYALEMKIIPRRYAVEELFDDVARALQA